MKRVISKVYDGIIDGKKYSEVFINPTDNEIEIVRSQDRFKSIRGVIYSDGTMIIWPGSYDHYNINRYINKSVDVNTFRFAYDPGSKDWLCDVNRMFSFDEIKKSIQSNLNQLKRIGDVNKPFLLIDLKDRDRTVDYYVFEDEEKVANKKGVYKMKRLIAKNTVKLEIWLETVIPAVFEQDGTDMEPYGFFGNTLPEIFDTLKKKGYEYKIMGDQSLVDVYTNSPAVIKKEKYTWSGFLTNVDKTWPVIQIDISGDDEVDKKKLTDYFTKWGYNYTIEE